MIKASYWVKGREDDSVECRLCPHRCRIAASGAGLCKVRRNEGGVLYAAGYGKISSMQIDPVEKKPLYHFLPGADIFSIGGWGCNFRCLFCQNWSISQEFIDQRETVNPDEVIGMVEKAGMHAIAYTYNEPLVGLEFVVDCACKARKSGIRNVAVTNGYISSASGSDAIEAMDAFNVDIKSMDDSFYRRNCGGSLGPVLEFCRAIVEAGRHLEVTNLVIPGENDAEPDIDKLARWISVNLGRRVPLHLSAYRPMYRMTRPATDEGVLLRAFDTARDHLDYVYLGNVGTRHGSNTECPACRAEVIERNGYDVRIKGVQDGACTQCGAKLDGFIWS